MGGLCSKSAKGDKVFAKADAHSDTHKSDGKNRHSTTMVPSDLTSARDHEVDKKKQEGAAAAHTGTGSEDFYDGIPRFNDSFPHKSRSVRSRQAVAKVGYFLFLSLFLLLHQSFFVMQRCVSCSTCELLNQ